MKHKKTKCRQLENGFGVLEALVASGIMAVFAAGVVLLGVITVRSTVINKHRLQAAYLAQEAVEASRNIRDTNWVDENPETSWDQNFPQADGVTSDWGIELVTSLDNIRKWQFKQSSDYFDSSLNQFEECNDCLFERKIIITRNTNSQLPLDAKTLKLSVVVTWLDYSKERNVTINSDITDWMMY